jgi:hypothetical protein
MSIRSELRAAASPSDGSIDIAGSEGKNTAGEGRQEAAVVALSLKRAQFYARRQIQQIIFSETRLGVAARNTANSGIGVTPRPVLLELLSLLEVLVFIPERFSHLFRCSGNY